MNGIYSQLQENIEKYKKEVFQKFLSTKFFIDKSGILSRIWSFLYSLNINSEILNYLTNNFLLPEKQFYNIILNDFYLKINNIEDINKYVNFSKQMNFFYEENGFLWMDLIEQKIPSDKDQDFYNNLLINIDKEISSLSILKDYESLKNEYNNCYQILDKKKDEIKENIKYNESEKREFEKQISELKKRIRELNLRKEIQKWKNYYINKLNNLNIDSPTFQEKFDAIKNDINQLKRINEEEMNKYIGNDLTWENPLPQENEYNENQIN